MRTRRKAVQVLCILAYAPCNHCISVSHLSRRGLLRAASGSCALCLLPPAATAASPSKEQTQRDYDFFAAEYDALDGGPLAAWLGIEDLRRSLPSPSGRVLDVAVGTGLNLRLYNLPGITHVDACDLSPGMLRQASARATALGMSTTKLTLHEMDVERLQFADGTFDTVVDTFSLCVFQDPVRALREMRRVCKSDGRVLLVENSRSTSHLLAAYQDVTAPLAAQFGKGCAWNQDVEALLRESGLRVVASRAVAGGLFRAFECRPSV
ncbi:unnamed protein product [Phaeothamnion confervicola]